MVRAGNIMFSLENDGELVDLPREPHRIRAAAALQGGRGHGHTWALPAISGNRIFVKDVVDARALDGQLIATPTGPGASYLVLGTVLGP